jgi:5'-nucleotidase, C-terminal domain
VDTPIGESQRHLRRSEVKLLVERAMAEESHTDFAFVNSGGLRDDLPQGPLLARHIWNIMPFDNIVVITRIKGSDVPAVLAKGHPLDPNREYTLASTDFTAANPTAELAAAHVKFTADGPLLRDLLIEWINKQKVVGGD